MAKCKNVASAAEDRRKELNCLFKKTIGNDNVYFQPPPDIQMKYPCIVYELDNLDPIYADDITYKVWRSYQVTLITREPNSCLIDKVSYLPRIHFNRFYAVDNLNHYVFTMYY